MSTFNRQCFRTVIYRFYSRGQTSSPFPVSINVFKLYCTTVGCKFGGYKFYQIPSPSKQQKIPKYTFFCLRKNNSDENENSDLSYSP